MLNFVSIFTNLFYEHSSSFVAAGILKLIVTWIINLFSMLLNLIYSLLWTIVKFVLGIMEAFEYIVNSFLGINGTVDDYISFAREYEFLDTLVTVFRAILAIAIVLLIIFSIYAIFKQEFDYASSGFEKTDKKGNSTGSNSKGVIIRNLLLKLASMFLLPITMIFILYGVSAILNSFNRALMGDNSATVASRVLSSSTYSGNKYRQYADSDKRLPIIIEVYDASEYAGVQDVMMAETIKSRPVQNALISAASVLNAGNGISFQESLKYQNNKLSNSSAFGRYYETFICTAEQYRVMADFIDYCEETNSTYYIKSVDDEQIEWKYVDSAIHDENNHTLTINYVDASDLDRDGLVDDTYTITYSTSYEVTSPISNAIDTIMALLGLGEYSDNTYNIMERDENSTNIVQWANEEVLIKFSEGFNVADASTWTPTDEIIMYEYYHFSSNNTFAEYSLSDLFDSGSGAILDAQQIVYRDYYPGPDVYSEEKTIEVVYINGTYYKVELSETETNEYGNKYYVLQEIEDVNFLDRNVVTVTQRVDNALLMLSSGFDINDFETWTYTDQIIVYEYYKDLSYNNNLSRYTFSEFYAENSGVTLPSYTISTGDIGTTPTENNYVLLNGTYYRLDTNNQLYNIINPDNPLYLFTEISSSNSLYYNYTIRLSSDISNGIYYIDENNNKTASDFIITQDDVDLFQSFSELEPEEITEEMEEYSSFSYTLSEGFDYGDTETWTYRDYFLFYLYIMYPNIVTGLNALKFNGLVGDVGVATLFGETEERYLLRLELRDGTGESIYLDIDELNAISQFNMLNELDVDETLYYNNTTNQSNELFIQQVEGNELISAETEYVNLTLSENFSLNNVSSWSVLDMLLVMLAYENIICDIDNGGIDSLIQSGYTSLVYRIQEEITVDDGSGNITTTTVSNTLYKFGAEFDATNNESTIYLDSNQVIALGYISVNDWFSGSAIEFISRRIGTTSSSLIATYDGIIDTIYSNYAGFVYNVDDIIDIILSNAGNNPNYADNVYNLFDSIVTYTYTNTNPDFSGTDPSTWTNIDFALYYLLGRVYSTYTSNVISYNGRQYFVVGRYAIDISGQLTSNPFSATIAENNTIVSNNAGIDEQTITILNEAYNELVNSIFYDASELEGLIRYTNNQYTYTTAVSIDTSAETNIVPAGATYLDIILAKENGTLSANSSFNFDVFSDGTNYYIEVGDNFVQISDSLAGNISFSTTGTISFAGTSSIFTHTSDYTSFAGRGTSDVTKLDGIIYSLTGATEQTVYPVYSYNGSLSDAKSFIYVNGDFIEYLPSDTSVVNTFLTGDREVVSSIYNEYYRNSVIVSDTGTIIPEETQSGVGTMGTYYIQDGDAFDIDNISTWSPLKILLYLQDISYREIIGRVLVSLDGNRTYFTFNSTRNGITYYYCVNITDFAIAIPVTDASGNVTYSIQENEDILFDIKLAMVLLGRDGEDLVQIDDTIESYYSFEEYINNTVGISSRVVENYNQTIDLTVNGMGTSFSLTNPLTWTWFDLIYYASTNGIREDTQFVIYTDSSNNNYVAISSVDNFVTNINYLQINMSTVMDQIVTNNPYNVTFEGDSAFEPISIIISQLKNLDTETEIDYYTVNGLDPELKFYFFSGSDNLYYVAYSENPDDLVTTSGGNGVSTESYTYNPQSVNSFVNYTVFDFILSYVAGSDSAINFTSQIYTFENNEYFQIDGNYLNITTLLDNNIITLNDVAGTISTDVAGSIIRISDIFGYKDNILRVFTADTIPDEVLGSSTGVDGDEQILHFSGSFDPSDYSTWQVSDFIIYYLYKSGDILVDSFQEDIVNVGGARVYISNLIVTDAYGNSTVKKVIRFVDGRKQDVVDEDGNVIGEEDAYYLDYDVFMYLYSRILRNPQYLPSSGSSVTVNVETESSYTADNPMTSLSFEYQINLDSASGDFSFNNYYYFSTDSTQLDNLGLSEGINETFIAAIENGDAQYDKSINVKLSENFDINNIGSWTVLDYIIMYEFSRSVKNNFFDGLSFADLKNDNYYFLFEEEGSGEDSTLQVLAINGNYYNIHNYIEKENPDDPESLTYKSNNVLINSNGTVVSEGEVDAYSFRVLESTKRFVVFDNEYMFELDNSENALTYNKFNVDLNGDLTVDTTVKYNRVIDDRVSFNYQVDPDDWDDAEVSYIVRKVNWPQKLMNDMQVIYPDLNWETLIATEGWLDTMGDYSSAIASGIYVTEGNSANITAAGMVLSEFFVSLAKESYEGFADYEYESVFDEHTLNALMLAMLGEDNYEALKFQAEIYTDLFNSCFAQVLDDIAREKGISIKDGGVDNITMSVYKAYLSTVLMSSDLSEYLYTVATRVYAQYTVYEYLASASGDYAKYYDYINGLPDENGDIVDSFTYSTFYELTQYENQDVASAIPTFTFNFEKVYKALINENASDSEIENAFGNASTFNNVLTQLDNYYSSVYKSGKVEDTDDLYCFMLDAYWTMYYEYVNAGNSLIDVPEYLVIYHDYILGKIARWSIIDSISMTGGANYVYLYDSYEVQRNSTKLKIFSSAVKIFFPDLLVNFSIDTLVNSFSELFQNGDATSIISSAYNVVTECFSTSSAVYKQYLNYLTPANLIGLANAVGASEEGSEGAWNLIIETNEAVTAICDEMIDCINLSSGSRTQNGTLKSDRFTDELYDNILNTLLTFQEHLQNYISAQEMLDMITKTSVTYALAQFGQNYISTGYKFTIENRSYTLSTTTSSLRLAEYVYGGAFLTQFGINATFTSNDFEGIIQVTRAYDSSTNTVKFKLENWRELREFATSIADYTAKLYFMTNLNDLSENISDGILMTDYITIQNSAGAYIQSTLEYAILDAMINSDEFDISMDTFISLMFGDTVSTLSNLDQDILNTNYSLVVSLANSLAGLSSSLSETDKREALNQYLLLVQSNIYTNYGYYNNNNNASERIHAMFVNVFTYLLVNEEDQSGENAVAINFDGWTMKDFRTTLMQFIVDYEQNPGETGQENAARYLAIFKLLSSQFSYTAYTDINDAVNRVELGTVIGSVYLSKVTTADNNDIAYYYIDARTQDEGSRRNILGVFSIDKATCDNIIGLAGVSNRPIEELVNLEYDDLYDLNGNYDEAYGDSFVVCFYDEVIGKYIPYMATSSSTYNRDGLFAEYMNDYGRRVRTNYYANGTGYPDAYPIIAKGIITEDGKPTAIKMEDYQVKYYRTNITTTGDVDDSVIQFSQVISETNTVGYTNYVQSSTFIGVDSLSNRNTMFIGSSDPTFYLESNYDVFYIQYTYSYAIPGSDEFGGISVLDQFSSFYKFDFMTIFLLLLSFVTILPLLFRASANLMRRVLDLIFYVLAGPLAISMSALNYEDGVTRNQAFETWKKRITFTLLSVFGYVIGFNVYFILLSTISNMTLVSDITRDRVSAIAEIPFLTHAGGFIDMIIRCFFYVIAGGVIKTSADIIVKIVTVGKVERAFDSFDGDAVRMIKANLNDVKKAGKVAVNLYTGDTLLRAKDAALETAKNMVPGSAVVRGINEKVQRGKTKAQAKMMSKALQKNGIPKSVAKQAAKEFQEKQNKQREIKRKKRIENANKFYEDIGVDDFRLDNPVAPPKQKKDTSARKDKMRKKYKKKFDKKNAKENSSSSKKSSRSDEKENEKENSKQNEQQKETPDSKNKNSSDNKNNENSSRENSRSSSSRKDDNDSDNKSPKDDGTDGPENEPPKDGGPNGSGGEPPTGGGSGGTGGQSSTENGASGSGGQSPASGGPSNNKGPEGNTDKNNGSGGSQSGTSNSGDNQEESKDDNDKNENEPQSEGGSQSGVKGESPVSGSQGRTGENSSVGGGSSASTVGENQGGVSGNSPANGGGPNEVGGTQPTGPSGAPAGGPTGAPPVSGAAAAGEAATAGGAAATGEAAAAGASESIPASAWAYAATHPRQTYETISEETNQPPISYEVTHPIEYMKDMKHGEYDAAYMTGAGDNDRYSTGKAARLWAEKRRKREQRKIIKKPNNQNPEGENGDEGEDTGEGDTPTGGDSPSPEPTGTGE